MPECFECHGCDALITQDQDYVNHYIDCDAWGFYVKFHANCLKVFRDRERQLKQAKRDYFGWF